jgi:GAF domain-containing protein
MADRSWQRIYKMACLNQELNQELSTVEELFATIHRRLGSILEVGGTFLLAIYNSQTDDVRLLYDQEERVSAYRSLQNVCRQVIRNQQPLFVSHLSREAEQVAVKLSNYARAELKESLAIVPLLVRDNAFGALVLHHPCSDAYTLDDLSLFQLLATSVALAAQNIRLYTNISQLNEAGQLLNQHLDPEETLQATVEKVRESTRADLVGLFPCNQVYARYRLSPRISGHVLDDASLKVLLADYEGPYAKEGTLINRLLRSSTPIFARHSSTLYRELSGGEIRNWQNTFEQLEFMSSTAALPLRINDEAVGVLLLYFRQPQRFDAAQKLLISGLAQYAAVAIKNVQTYGALRLRRIQELITLSSIDRELNRSLELREILELILNLALKQTPADVATFALYDSHKQELWTAAAVGRQREERSEIVLPLKQQKGIMFWVMEQKRAARVNNVRSDQPWCDLYFPTSKETLSELDVPLLDGDTLVGVLNFESVREGAFSEEDEAFLQTLAGQAVLAVTRIQREKEVAAHLNERENRVMMAEAMISIGHSAFELAHRLGNELGLLPTHVDNVMTALLAQDVRNPFIQEKLQAIRNAVRNVLQLNKKLKEDMSSLSLALYENDFRAVHPLELLQEAQASVSIPAMITVTCCSELDSDVARIWVVPLSISDILHNLITNAIEAMPDGGRLELWVYRQGGQVALEVRDTGIGIPEHLTDKIFGLFFSTKGSSGFGLWSARMNTLRNRGDLTVKSAPGQGATFTLLLPLANGGKGPN